MLRALGAPEKQQTWPSLRSSLLPHQLLVAHVRFTIAINTKAREQLICEYGLFDKVGASHPSTQGKA